MNLQTRSKVTYETFNIYENKSSPKATSSFVSKDQRFKYKPNNLPGPGAYESSAKNFKPNAYHVSKDTSLNPQIRKQHMWILGSNRTSYLNNPSNSSIGPGSYYYHEAVMVKGFNTNWGKSERFNVHAKKNNTMNPGPGDYEQLKYKSKNKNHFGSVFRSKSPKTYFEKIGEEKYTNSYNKNVNSIQDLIDNPNPELQDNKSLNKSHDASKKDTESKKHADSIFASKIPRFSYQKTDTQVGPGSYEINSLLNSKSKNKLPKIISVQSEDRAKKTKKINKQTPGPGPATYNDKIKTIEKSLEENKRSVVIDRQERFNNKIQTRPGPGHYMDSKYQYISTESKNKTKNKSTQRAGFGSTLLREQGQQSLKQGLPFGDYNVDIYDIEYKMKKKQEHLEKLKIMQVTLPAFNTKSKR